MVLIDRVYFSLNGFLHKAQLGSEQKLSVESLESNTIVGEENSASYICINAAGYDRVILNWTEIIPMSFLPFSLPTLNLSCAGRLRVR